MQLLCRRDICVMKLLCNENEKVKTHQDKGKLTSLNWKLNS